MNSSSIPELCCIDFPGYSATPKNLVDLAGGSTGIQKSFQKGVSLPLYLRPKDPFSRPIVGEIVPTGNLLIKLIKKKNKRTGEIKLDYEVVGFINKTARYRAIADYQVVPDAKDPIVKLRKDMQEWNRDGIDNFRFTYEQGLVEDLKILPPPVFSFNEWALPYEYKQNPAIVKVLVQGQDDASHSEVLVNRHSRTERLICHSFSNFKDQHVPTEPPENFVPSSSVPQEAIQEIEALFQQRPIWTRLAIVNLTSPQYVKNYIKQTLPRVAYHMSKGPWRDSWVRYGYDPRQEPDSANLQVLCMRLVRRQTYRRAQRVRGVSVSQATPSNKTTSHVFDGQSVPKSSSFQLCDIVDPEIDTKGTLRSKCSKTSGWYSQAFLEKLRKQVKKKLRKLKGENVASDSDEATSDQDDEDDEQEGETSEEEKEESAPEPEMDVTEKVRSKVNEMMRSLQASQKDAQHDDALQQQDMEELEMFDVFDGDDSSESEYEDS